MPFQIHWEPKGLHCKFYGKCQIQDVVDAFETIGSDHRFDELRYQIFDYLEVEEQNATEEEVAAITGIDFAHYLTNPQILYVSVCDDARIDALVDYYIRINDFPHRQKRCRTLQDARDLIADAFGKSQSLLR